MTSTFLSFSIFQYSLFLCLSIQVHIHSFTHLFTTYILNTTRKVLSWLLRGMETRKTRPSLRRRAVYNSQCCASFLARVLPGHLEDHEKFPEAVTPGSWWFGAVEAESMLGGWWQGRQEKWAGSDLQTLHGHSRESVVSAGGDEEAVNYSEQRSDRIRFLL